MYYLQSRYYDPEMGRFINADAFASTGQGLLGNNMFAYCLNNPVNYVDPSGGVALIDDALFIIVAVIAVAIVVMPPPPVQREIKQTLNSLGKTISQGIDHTARILSVKTKGKENVRDSGLANETDEEVIRKSHDKTLPKSERKRYNREAKARKARNVVKRKMLY